MSGPESWVGVDIGGTKAEVSLVLDGRVAASRRIPTGRQPPDSLVSAVAREVLALVEEAGRPRPGGVGIGVAGRVDPRTGLVRHAANLGWDDYPLRERMEEAVPVPVTILNDVQAAAFGESVYGAGRGAESLVALFVGTGIGGGIVDGGRLVRGSTGSAGEWGHAVVDYQGHPCTCGGHGCMETLAAGWGIAERAREAIARDPDAGAALLDLVRGSPERLSTRAVAEAARMRDPLAAALLSRAADALGAGVATIYNALDPERIVLGGGVLEGYPELVPMVEERARARLTGAIDRFPPVVAAGLGRHAGVVGAAEWARQSREH